MLPRVKLVLKKCLSPISESLSTPVRAVPDKTPGAPLFLKNTAVPQSHFQKAQQNTLTSHQQDTPSEPAQKSHLKLVPPPTDLPTEEGPALLQIFSSLRGQKGALIKWLGIASYKQSEKEKQNQSKFKKGSVLDENID